MTKGILPISALSLTALLAACGDSDPVEQPTPTVEAPTVNTTSLASGRVTGFSSIVVDGETIETDENTVYIIEGEGRIEGDDSVVELGRIVQVNTRRNPDGSRTAVTVILRRGTLGVVDSISPDADNPQFGTFEVAGQTITVDANTVFDDDFDDLDGINGVDIRDLDPALSPGGTGLVVEISGFPTEFGALASRIDLIDDIDPETIGTPGVQDDEVVVLGFVDAVDVSGDTFTINGATFNVTGETEFEDVTFDETLEGRFIEVQADIDADGNFIALDVESESDLDDLSDEEIEEGDEFEIEGLLTSVDLEATPNLIVINGTEIPTVDASSLQDLVGLIVEVEGEFNADSVLVIDEAEVEQENTIRIEDTITAVDTDAGTITTRLGIEITPTGASRLEIERDSVDDSNLTPAQFLDALVIGHIIDARGFNSDDGIVWNRIEVEEAEAGEDQICRVEGPVDDAAIATPSFSIIGVEIDTTSLGDDDFEDEDGDALGRTGFFDALAPGLIVEARSDNEGLGCAVARLQTFDTGEVAFDDDDDVAGNERSDNGRRPGRDDDDDDADGINRIEVEGVVGGLDSDNNQFNIRGRRITVTDDTLIDDDIVAEARGEDAESEGDGFRFGDLAETLGELLANGDQVEVVIDADGNAISIEFGGD